jgi:hypothetical protein
MRFIMTGMFVVAIAVVMSWCISQQQKRLVAAADGTTLPQTAMIRRQVLHTWLNRKRISHAAAMQKLSESAPYSRDAHH